MDGLDFQEINKSELENEFTIGAEYYGKKYVESVSVVKRQAKTIPLGQMWVLATDGDHGSPDYQESGVLYLLSECVKDGYIEKAKCRYITEAKNRELKRSCLHPGDIVVTKTGVYFGKSAVIPESIPEANTIAHVGKITLKSQYNPYYVSTFLNCKYGYYQLRRRGIYAIIYQVPFNGFGRLDRENIYATRRGEYAPLIATKAVEWFADYVYALRNALFHEIISPLDEDWQAIFKSAYLLLKQVSDICISCISQIDEFPQTQENAVFEYAENHKAECFDPLADHVELLDFPKMKLSDWKIEKGKITLKGWFFATLKLQQGDAEAVENGTGSITTEDKGFDFSITLGDDFKIAKDKETQKEIIEIKLQGA